MQMIAIKILICENKIVHCLLLLSILFHFSIFLLW